LRFASPAPVAAQPEAKAKREPRAKQKNDAQLVAAARELRDRWLEEVNAQPRGPTSGKYDVSRAMGETVTIEVNAGPLAIAPPKRLAAA
jgi:hypothetical protein